MFFSLCEVCETYCFCSVSYNYFFYFFIMSSRLCSGDILLFFRFFFFIISNFFLVSNRYCPAQFSEMPEQNLFILGTKLEHQQEMCKQNCFWSKWPPFSRWLPKRVQKSTKTGGYLENCGAELDDTLYKYDK